MRRRTGFVAALSAIALAAVWTIWPARSDGQANPPPDRVRQLEREVEILKAEVKQLKTTIGELSELMQRLNNAVRDPQVQKQLAELRAALTPTATGKARKLAELTKDEKAEIMQLEGLVKISTNPIEDQGKLVSRLWDFCVYESAVVECEKLLRAEQKVNGDRWRQLVADRLNRDFGRFDKPDEAESFLRIVLEHPLTQENEKGLAWINSSAGACRQLYTAEPNKFKAYLPRAIKLYEASLKLNPTQPEVKAALKQLRQAKSDADAGASGSVAPAGGDAPPAAGGK